MNWSSLHWSFSCFLCHFSSTEVCSEFTINVYDIVVPHIKGKVDVELKGRVKTDFQIEVKTLIHLHNGEQNKALVVMFAHRFRYIYYILK